MNNDVFNHTQLTLAIVYYLTTTIYRKYRPSLGPRIKTRTHTETKHREAGDVSLYIKNVCTLYKCIANFSRPKDSFKHCITVYENAKYEYFYILLTVHLEICV
jgi:hypothetical protein